jgi:predicted NBD/HSP70 family sugar kinase
MRSVTDASDLFSQRRVPELKPEQVGRFTLAALRARRARNFDPRAALEALGACESKAVVAIDIGGDKMAAVSYVVHDGRLVQTTEALLGRGDGGSGYVTLLEETARRAQVGTLSVGVSYAGEISGTKLITGPNLPAFIAEMFDRYGGDFGRLFPQVVVANDAEAGIMASALEAIKWYPDMRQLIYVINGSGLGGAVLSENTIFATEPGHIEVVPELNPLSQDKPCGVLGAGHVCLEGIAASKAGVEDIWFRQRGDRLNGRQIAAICLTGDELAADLYDNSALGTAHAIKGMSRAFGLPENFDQTIIVGHGGIFHVPGYGARVKAILAKDLSHVPSMIFTNEFSTNACLEGVAIAAVTKRLPGATSA